MTTAHFNWLALAILTSLAALMISWSEASERLGVWGPIGLLRAPVGGLFAEARPAETPPAPAPIPAPAMDQTPRIAEAAGPALEEMPTLPPPSPDAGPVQDAPGLGGSAMDDVVGILRVDWDRAVLIELLSRGMGAVLAEYGGSLYHLQVEIRDDEIAPSSLERFGDESGRDLGNIRLSVEAAWTKELRRFVVRRAGRLHLEHPRIFFVPNAAVAEQILESQARALAEQGYGADVRDDAITVVSSTGAFDSSLRFVTNTVEVRHLDPPDTRSH